MNETIIDELKEDFETLLSMSIEVKKNNTDEFMIYFKGRVNGLVSKYFEGADWGDARGGLDSEYGDRFSNRGDACTAGSIACRKESNRNSA